MTQRWPIERNSAVGAPHTRPSWLSLAHGTALAVPMHPAAVPARNGLPPPGACELDDSALSSRRSGIVRGHHSSLPKAGRSDLGMASDAGAGGKLLVVDDDEQHLRMTARVLSHAGYAVVARSDVIGTSFAVLGAARHGALRPEHAAHQRRPAGTPHSAFTRRSAVHGSGCRSTSSGNPATSPTASARSACDRTIPTSSVPRRVIAEHRFVTTGPAWLAARRGFG